MRVATLLALALPVLLPGQSGPLGWNITPAGTQIAVDRFPISARLSPDRKFLIVLNEGTPPSLSVLEVASSKEISRVPVPDGWLGLTMTKAGDRVYVGGASRAAVYEFAFTNGTLKPSRMFPVIAEKDRSARDFIGDVQLAPDGHLLYAADLYRDSIVVINPQSGLILSRIKTGRRPYRILFQPSGKRMYVSSWADGSIGQYDVASGTLIGNLRVAPHPTDMTWVEGEPEDQPGTVARLFVSASNTNNVYELGANESGDLRRLETINVGLTSRQPLGVTPSGLGASADGKRLLVACSGINAAAVLDISSTRTTVLGLIPTGRYPTAALGLPDGRVAVLNGHDGAVQTVDVADETRLPSWTAEVMANSPYRDGKVEQAGVRSTSVRHVVYILSDAQSPGPEMNRIASQFVRLENFHSVSDNPAALVNWATAGIETDYTERMLPVRPSSDNYEGRDPADSPPAGFIWTAAAQAGISIHNYGFYATNRQTADTDGTQLMDVRDPVLAPVTDPNFRASDPAYPDSERAKEFISELHDFEKEGTMPQLLFVRMGADDAALGTLVEAISKSRFWSDTAVFVAARNKCLIASPWVRHAATDSTPYDSLSVLRTIELIFGLRPMTTFDAAAQPMLTLFMTSPNPEPYSRVSQ